MPQKKKLTYKQSGVDYDVLDLLKRCAQKESKTTLHNLPKGITELSKSRGESAYVMDIGDRYLAVVEEGLGTKNLIADTMYEITGKTYYDQIAQDTIGTMVNDLITVGAYPLSVSAYWAVGSSDWFKDKKRMSDLVKGWAHACNMAGVVWGGGETPTLSGIVKESAIDLAGACYGIIDPKDRLTLGKKLISGDHIVMFESSGIHANGLTLARKIGEKLSHGFKTKISDGRMYGEAILDGSILYPKLIQDLFDKQIDIHYMAHITGHGWRKLMRLNNNFTYRISTIPPVPPVLLFLVEQAGLNDEEAYSTFNMGGGYAVYIPRNDVEKTIKIAKKHKIKAYEVGVVEKGKKQVIIEPLNITYNSGSLNIRN
ncbi:phosphoribosylformylglycinamidine cyclo-ligase [Candidatus Roizmanbacteria bacterium CG_4_10_14_0_2_um_filter_39_13]|uniref:Phosphoribosylformylglycinamidine cyclo-ligase n=1 Tax=Candidatus Roizmanbacteria bacterium CG_4_10_14_0_2_um_filter_39_13 TaxID=1974825 RepID=A0A2M7U1U1_9BACT|nr:MAG: phosphoribosylformylglycinamidine cyclo-ligase [Candidatus Roizmanbacteria bacterium CG_4_10_14_0_2_um_filter_39_13]